MGNHNSGRKPTHIKIRAKKTGDELEFDSLTEMAQYFGSHQSSTASFLRGKTQLNTVYDIIELDHKPFVKPADWKEHDPNDRRTLGNARTQVDILILETGEVKHFESVQDASFDLRFPTHIFQQLVKGTAAPKYQSKYKPVRIYKYGQVIDL